MSQTAIDLRHNGHVATLVLRASEWRAVDLAACSALATACEHVRDDHSIRAVIVTGEGGRFCGDWSDTPGARAGQRDGLYRDAFQPLADLAQPVIAAIAGPAHGAALELALAADIRIAAEGATFMLCDGESVPLAGGLTRLSRAIGRAAATSIALGGAALSVEDALAVGLVSAVLPADALLPEAERIAALIAARGPIAARFAKEALRHGPDLTLPQALRYETDLTIILQTTADRAEGVAAFAEKREPRFEDR